MPKVSILMAVYNGERYLRQAVESILDQTFRDFEFIIFDDGSADSTWDILTEYANRDQRILLVQNEENIGLTKSLNKGLALAQGEYVARQDADDISLPERLKKQVKLLDQHSGVVLASCNLETIDSEGHLVEQSPLLAQKACDPNIVAWHLLFYNHLGGHSQVMFRRKPVIELGGYSEARRYSQDYELWSRLVEWGNIVILPKVLLQWRLHNEGISTKSKSKQLEYSLANTKRNLSRFVHEELSQEQVAELRSLWAGYPYYPKAGRLFSTHTKLKQIYQGFLQQRKQQNFYDPSLPRQLRILIGKRFLFWIQTMDKVQSMSTPSRLLRKFVFGFYAFIWYPSGVLQIFQNRQVEKQQKDHWLRENVLQDTNGAQLH